MSLFPGLMMAGRQAGTGDTLDGNESCVSPLASCRRVGAVDEQQWSISSARDTTNIQTNWPHDDDDDYHWLSETRHTFSIRLIVTPIHTPGRLGGPA